MRSRKDAKKHPAVVLRDLMGRAGYTSQKSFAQALGYKDAPGIQKYLDTGRAATALPVGLVRKLLITLVGKGDPPIARAEIVELGDFSQLTDTVIGPTVISTDNQIVNGRNVPLFGVEEIVEKVHLHKATGDRAWVFVEEPIGENAIAIRLNDASMEPEFALGSILTFSLDVDAILVTGDYVLAIVPDSEVALVRRYREKGRNGQGAKLIELAALNEDKFLYPSLICPKADVEIVGVLVSASITKRYKKQLK